MMALHFLRPWFLFGLLPTAYFIWRIWHHHPISNAWKNACDPHLLNALLEQQGPHQYKKITEWLLILSLSCMWIAAAGPAWKKIPLPIYASSSPKMIVLDSSKSMLAADLTPDRLQRAKFVIEDLLNLSLTPPIGMIAYTSEPFVVSPLTNDTQTISALLPSLDTDTPPIGGQNLASAIDHAAQIIKQANYNFGAILVLTGTPPDAQAVSMAAKLHQQGFTVSILHVALSSPAHAFTEFANAGGGINLSLSHLSSALKQWLHVANRNQTQLSTQLNNIPRWQDEGRWFILPALLCLLPVFQRGRLWGMG
jgi:Ca-activated chloride channel family protein